MVRWIVCPLRNRVFVALGRLLCRWAIRDVCQEPQTCQEHALRMGLHVTENTTLDHFPITHRNPRHSARTHTLVGLLLCTDQLYNLRSEYFGSWCISPNGTRRPLKIAIIEHFECHYPSSVRELDNARTVFVTPNILTRKTFLDTYLGRLT